MRVGRPDVGPAHPRGCPAQPRRKRSHAAQMKKKPLPQWRGFCLCAYVPGDQARCLSTGASVAGGAIVSKREPFHRQGRGGVPRIFWCSQLVMVCMPKKAAPKTSALPTQRPRRCASRCGKWRGSRAEHPPSIGLGFTGPRRNTPRHGTQAHRHPLLPRPQQHR